MTATTTSVPVSRPPRAFFIVLVLLVTAAVGLGLGAIIQQSEAGADSAAPVAYWPDEPLNHHTPHLFGSDAIDPAVQATEAYGAERVLRLMEQAGGAYAGSNLATEAYKAQRFLRLMEQAGGAYAGSNQGEIEPIIRGR